MGALNFLCLFVIHFFSLNQLWPADCVLPIWRKIMITMAQWLWVYTDYSWCLKNALKIINRSLTHPEQISKQAWCTNYGCNQETFSCTTFWTPLSLVFLRSCLLKMCVLCVMIKFKTRSTTWKHYTIIACNWQFWITITYGIYMPTLVKIKIPTIMTWNRVFHRNFILRAACSTLKC